MAGLNNVELMEKSSWLNLKWQYIVLAVGGPVAIGFGYWYVVKKFKKNDPPPKICGIDRVSTTVDSLTKANSSSELSSNNSGSELKVKIETPLERAVALKASGNVFFKSRNYEDAIRCYTEAIDVCPEHEHTTLSLCYQNLAATHEQMENYNGVIECCTSALKLDPVYVKALQRRAKAYEFVGQLHNSLEDTTAVCILEHFKNEQSLYMADRILQQIGKESAKKAMENRQTVSLSKHFVKAYFVSFNNDPILKNYHTQLNGHASGELEENNLVSGLEKAKRCLVNSDYESVIPACNEELEANPTSWEALLLRSTMLFLFGEQKRALDDFNAIIEGDCPTNAIKSNALIKRASLHLQLDAPDTSAADKLTMRMKPEIVMPEKCMRDFEEALTLDPTNADIYHHRGQVYLLMDQMDLAVKDFKKALEREPNMPVVQVQLYYAQYRVATLLKDGETIANTFDLFKELIKKHPNCIESYTLYIQLCTEQEDYNQADEYFKKAIKVDPGNATIRVQRATLYLQWKADIDTAVKLIEEAIQIDERCEYGYETLGTIEVQRGNLERAIVLFDKALQYAKSERELAHIFSLRDAAKAQAAVVARLGLPYISQHKPS